MKSWLPLPRHSKLLFHYLHQSGGACSYHLLFRDLDTCAHQARISIRLEARLPTDRTERYHRHCGPSRRRFQSDGGNMLFPGSLFLSQHRRDWIPRRGRVLLVHGILCIPDNESCHCHCDQVEQDESRRTKPLMPQGLGPIHARVFQNRHQRILLGEANETSCHFCQISQAWMSSNLERVAFYSLWRSRELGVTRNSDGKRAIHRLLPQLAPIRHTHVC